LNGTPVLAEFVNDNAGQIIAEQDLDVPQTFTTSAGTVVPFAGGSSLNPFFEWSAPGILDNEARFHFSLNTCSGCHGPETNTSFLMVAPRSAGSESVLSPFLTGTVAFDQTSGQQRSLNELGRRRADLAQLVCSPPTDGGALPAPPTIGPQADGGSPPPQIDAGSPPPVLEAGAK
jgi:hypothetical protein